jgi:ATP-dependent protease ClpP protease subunit
MTPAQPKPPEIVYIIFSAEIKPHTVESLLGVLANCANQGVKTVYLVLSTPGGDVMSGITLYNVMSGMPFEIITHNAGNVDSIGNAVFLAGARRYACPHSTFMFHGVGFDVGTQAIRLEEKNVREMLGNIENNHGRIGSIIKERTKLQESAIPELFREAQTKDAAFAVGCGIIDEIRDIQIPPNATVISLVFQR